MRNRKQEDHPWWVKWPFTWRRPLCWTPVLLACLEEMFTGGFSTSLHPFPSPGPSCLMPFLRTHAIQHSLLFFFPSFRLPPSPVDYFYSRVSLLQSRYISERVSIIEASVLWHIMYGYLFLFVWRVNLVSSKMIENMFILLRLFEVGRMWWQLWVNSSKNMTFKWTKNSIVVRREWI